MYDQIADLYHLVYPDWDAAIASQAQTYFDAGREILGAPPARVLDVSCGIGTQALGLARLGCSVSASDLSAGAVARARREAEARGLAIDLKVADMRRCQDAHGKGFDLVLSADNSVPHLAGGDAVRAAFEGMHQCLRPGGAILIGVRDYKPGEERSQGQVFLYGTREFEGHRYVVFQTRDWEGDSYEAGMYFVREESQDAPARVVCGKSHYYAITVEELTGHLERVGFEGVQRLDGVTHNVVLRGTRSLSS